MTCLRCKYCEEWEENPYILLCNNFESDEYAEEVGIWMGNAKKSNHEICEKFEDVKEEEKE